MIDRVGRDHHGSDRAERVEGLAEIEVRRLRGELHRSIGDVLADHQPDDVAPGVGRFDVLAAAPDHHDEFTLVVDRIAAQLDIGRRADETRRELREHQRVGGHIHPALVGVGLIVQADRVDVARPRHRRTEFDAVEVAARFAVTEAGRQRSQPVGVRERRHRVGVELTVRHRREVVPVLAGDQRRSALDVGQPVRHVVSFGSPTELTVLSTLTIVSSIERRTQGAGDDRGAANQARTHPPQAARRRDARDGRARRGAHRTDESKRRRHRGRGPRPAFSRARRRGRTTSTRQRTPAGGVGRHRRRRQPGRCCAR